MRKLLLLTTTFLLFAVASFAQVNILYEVDGDNLLYNESGCGDEVFSGNPDPRWRVRVTTSGTDYDWNENRDDVSCNVWLAITNYNLVPERTGATNSTIQVRMDGFEEDWGSGNDFVCGGYSNVNIYDPAASNPLTIGNFDPCTWNYHYADRFCGGGRYGIRFSFYYKYNQAPTLGTPTTNNGTQLYTVASGCTPTTTTITVPINNDGYGRCLGRFYKWQVAEVTNCANVTEADWVDIGAGTAGASGSISTSATSVSFTPYAINGTRLYRVLVVPTCSADWNSSLVSKSQCVRITTSPQNGTQIAPAGDYPFRQPDLVEIISPACGATVLPGTSNSFSTPVAPAINANATVTSYTWTVTPSAGVISTGTNTANATFTFPAPSSGTQAYTIRLTYGDGCAAADAFRECTVTVSQPDCNYIYVGPTGNDANTGGPNGPVRSIKRALQLVSGSRNYIRVANGTYNSANGDNVILDLVSGVTIEGGYTNTAGVWTKQTNSTTNITLSGSESISGVCHEMGFRSDNDDNWALIDLNITTDAASGTDGSGRGCSNYGVWIANASTGYTITRCNITSGAASRGLNGTSQGTAATGNAGNTGQNGHCDNNGDPNDTASPGTVGSGIRYGGQGGYGGQGSRDGSSDNRVGGNGGNGGGGAAGGTANGGTGANGGSGQDCNRDGRKGADGAAGAAGADQTTTPPTTNSTFGSYWVPNGQSASGSDGAGGGGGKGGGGGGRQSCTFCDNGPGSSGGSGGSGGEGGLAGTGGYGAGGSFGVYASGSSSGTISQSDLNIPGSVAQGGDRGLGGNGGTGGRGGCGGGGNNTSETGGNALGSNGGFCSTGRQCGNCEVGAGGQGGRGGDGGRGGHGQPGANGRNEFYVLNGSIQSDPSVAIPTTPTVLVDYGINTVCPNSMIRLVKGGTGNWVVPSGYTIVNDLNATTPSTSVSTNDLFIGTTSTSAGWSSIQVGSTVFPNIFKQINTTRTAPVIAAIPSICVGGSISPTASGGSYTGGTIVAHEWIVYVTNVTTPITNGTSSAATPTFDVSALGAGTYNVRYRVKELCCGWSTPAYQTFVVTGDPTAPSALSKDSDSNVGTVCTGANTLGVNAATGSTGGVDCAYEYATQNTDGVWLNWTTTQPSAVTAGSGLNPTGTVNIKARRNCTGEGCTNIQPETANVTWVVNSQPVAGEVFRVTPNTNTVCINTNVTVNVSGSSGGISAVDDIRYRVGTSGPWTTLNGPGPWTIALSSVGDYYFQTQRRETNLTNTGCVSATWPVGNGELEYSVVPFPVQQTVTANASTVCNTEVITINVSSSEVGVDYVLNNLTTGVNSAPVAGTGGPLSFNAGAYNVLGNKSFKVTATRQPCADVKMNNDVAVTVFVDNCAETVWTGAVSTDWNDSLNWLPKLVPTVNNNIIIPTTPNDPHVFTGDPNGTCKNISMPAQAVTITIDAGKTVEVKGDWDGSSNVIQGNGHIVFSGTTQQQIAGGMFPNFIRINNPAGANVLPGVNLLEVYKGLLLQQGVLVSNNSVFIKSSSTQTAYIDDFTSGYTGSVSGLVNVERYVPGGAFGYRFIGNPVNTTPGSFNIANLANFATTGLPGQVVPLPNCNPNNTELGSPWGNLMRWEESGPFPVANCNQSGWYFFLNGSLTSGRGYGIRAFSSTTLRFEGNANTGSISYGPLSYTNSTGNGWQLVANPFPSPIQISNVDANPNNNMPLGFQGQVQFYQPAGFYTGTYQAYNVSVSGQTPPAMAIAQGFWIRTVSANAFWTLSNSHRVTGSPFIFDVTQNVMHHLKVEVEGNTYRDRTDIHFIPGATNEFDDYDANKWESSAGVPTLYTTLGNEMVAINSMPALNEVVTVPMAFKPGANGNFTFTFDDIATFPQSAMIYLEDLQLGTMNDLRASNTYQFASTTTDNVNRFILHFQPGIKPEVADQDCDVMGSIELVQPAPTVWASYEVKGTDNNVYAQGTNLSGTITINNLPAQEYVVKLTHSSGYVAQEYITVNGANAVNATINASATNVQVNETVSFTATANNVNEYVWNFDDGNVELGTNTVQHTFESEGTYNVTLTASNEECNDIAVKTINVGNSTTGLNQNGAGKLNIYGQGERVVVEFNSWGGEKADIFMYNALGQRVESLTGVSTVRGRQEISVVGIKPGTYFIQVVSGGKIQGKKVNLGNY